MRERAGSAIAIELGGKKLIRVEDDGDGMEPEDARLAIERHATSKIASQDDLAAIRTLGFRGEALPSIASVSRFQLRTRARGSASGTEVRVEAGAVVSVREVGAPEGTCIEVADLFFNLPARRKFLKSDQAESSQISRLVTQMALGYPEVGFMLTSGGRQLLECPPAAGVPERFFQLFGDRPDLDRDPQGSGRPDGRTDSSRRSATRARSAASRTSSSTAASSRTGRSRTRSRRRYSVATIKERSPEVHLFIQIPPDRVDVNVHPTKAEVRFLEQSLVHEVLRRGLGDALGQGRAPELQLTADRRTGSRAAADDDSRRAGWRRDREPLESGARRRAAGVRADPGRRPEARQRVAAGSRELLARHGRRTRRRPAR